MSYEEDQDDLVEAAREMTRLENEVSDLRAELQKFKDAIDPEKQCKLCGRVGKDWAKKRDGQKLEGRADNLDRMYDYRDWRRKLRHNYYVSDIDSLEWRIVGGVPTPVVALEMTKVDGDRPPPPSYFAAILNRYEKQDAQAASIRHFAELLGCEAVIVAFRYDMSEFWLYNLTTGGEWNPHTPEQYKTWLRGQTGSRLEKKMGDTNMDLVKGTKTRLTILEETKIGDAGIQLANLAQAKVWAAEVASSGMAPKGMNTESKVLLAVQTGMELGFTPMRSLQAVVIVNGRATLMGEAALGLIRSSGMLETGTDIEIGCRPTTEEEKLAKEGNLMGYCRTTRRGQKQNETLFSMQDSKEAGLWGKEGPWTQYPKRMMQWRAVGFHMRDYWSDIGNGLMLSDEAQDMRAPARDVTPAHSATAPEMADPMFTPKPSEALSEAEPMEAVIVDEGRTGEVLDDRDGFASPAAPSDVEEGAGDTASPAPDPENTTTGSEPEEVDPDTGEVIPDDAGRIMD